MRLNDDLVVLPLTVARNGQTAVFHLSLITDAAHGPSLVDTGVPGQASAITALLGELGVELRDLRRIILTIRTTTTSARWPSWPGSVRPKSSPGQTRRTRSTARCCRASPCPRR